MKNFLVHGTPAVATTDDHLGRPQRWNLIVPCLSGGLLHTWTTGPSSSSSAYSRREEWQPVDLIATNLGVISAVSIATIGNPSSYEPQKIGIVAACIASARLHIIEENKTAGGYYSQPWKWKAQASIRIHHPGEVTGNSVLATTRTNQLDLLVPSAEGGIFHFVRTTSTHDEWHMIARIIFPQGLPAASCLAFNAFSEDIYQPRQFRAMVQSGGQLYMVKTRESSRPWSGSDLIPIVRPGPFSD